MALLPLQMPPIWRESRVALEAASLLRSSVFRGEGVEDAGGQPVVLVPGFLAGDDSLGLMTSWLRRTGHRTRSAGMRWNVDCSSAAADRLGERLECLADRHGQRVAIIGQSRGGNFAKVLAQRYPQFVSGIVTLGSPQTDPFDIHPIVHAQVMAMGTLGSLGVRGLFSHRCRWGNCCQSFWDDMRKPLRDDVRYVSVYSRTDGIVNWRACLDPHADRHVEVDASHIGMAVHRGTYRAVAEALEGFRAEPPRSRKAAPRRRQLSRAA